MDETCELKLFEKICELGLVNQSRACDNKTCKKYEKLMSLTIRKRSKESLNYVLSWRCTVCRSYRTVYENSFFSLFKKPVRILLAVIKCWAAQLTINKTIAVIEMNLNDKITKSTVSEIYFKLRQLCSIDIDRKNLKLGGFGKIIEIDESLYAKIKHGKGKLFF